MAGLYLHIPFCKKACHYCDFHFSTSFNHKSELIAALKKEIVLQKDFLGTESIESIYFGGGTPSLLNASELDSIITSISNNYALAADTEITLEANPDDLSAAYLKNLTKTSINRLSIGIQSFFDTDLQWMNRAHTAQEAESCVKRAQDTGLDNISIDLIYGLPEMSLQHWQKNMDQAFALAVPHLSAYCLTVEPRTALATFIKKGKSAMPNEHLASDHFSALMDYADLHGFIHYEISNFCQPGKKSRHNSNYWQGVPYLGIGPSAHSYKGTTRQWNVANNSKYLAALAKNEIPFERELLTETQQLNEYLMISLRTIEGIDLRKIGAPYLDQISIVLADYEQQEFLHREGNAIKLSRKGRFYADKIASDLFIV